MCKVCCQCFNENTCESGEIKCKNCLLMKRYLQVIVTELKSAHLMIKILQEHSKVQISTTVNTVSLEKCVNQSGSEKGDNDWIEVKNKHHNKSTRPTDCSKYQYPPVVHTSNRSIPLVNLQSQSTRIPHPRNSVLGRVPATTDEKKRNIFLIGESHVRGCSEELANLLGSSFR